MDSKNIHSYLKVLLLAALLITLYFSRLIVLTALIGIGIGVLLSPALDRLQRFKLKRGYAALLVIFGLFLLFTAVFSIFGWVIVDQASSMVEGWPETSQKIQTRMENLFERFPSVAQELREFNFGSTAQRAAQSIVKGMQASAVAVGGAVFAFIIGIYLAVDSDYYFKGLVRAFKPEKRKKAQETLRKCANVVRVWFRAQLIDMAIIGVITSLGLWIVGVRYWAVFGLLTAILGIIPYVGTIIVVAITSLVTLANDPSQVWWVLLVFFVTQQVEGNIVLPLVMKGQVQIPEAVLLIVMLFFGFWFGLLGVFVAPALVAVGICLYRELYLPRVEGKPHRA